MKIKTLIISSLLIAGILTGCNGQSATATIETETTTEIESTTESESTTSEIALENEKGMASFSSTQGKVEGAEIEIIEEETTEESTNSDIEADITGVDGTVAEGDYDELDHPETTPVVTDDMINDIVNDLVGKPSGGGGQATTPVPEGWSTELVDPGDYTGPGELLPPDPNFAGGQIDY